MNEEQRRIKVRPLAVLEVLITVVQDDEVWSDSVPLLRTAAQHARNAYYNHRRSPKRMASAEWMEWWRAQQ